MNDKQFPPENRPAFLIWIFSGQLDQALDASTWTFTARELRQLGWNMELIANGKDGRKMVNGTEVLCFSSPRIYLLRQIIYHLKIILYIILKWSRVDLILFNQPSAPWLLPLKILRKLINRRRPLLIMDTRTVPMEDEKKSSTRDSIRAWVYRIMNYMANQTIDGQTAITQRMAAHVKIPEGQLWGVWPSGAEKEMFEPACEKRVWPEAGEPIVLIYIGVLHYERNLMNLSLAVEKANAAQMKFRLILTGSGTEKDDLERFAQKTEGRIRVNSPIPHAEIPALLAQAHIGVLPFPDLEKYRVSSPIKLFEYMASGLAVMATRVVCHTDVVRNGTYCFWAEDSSADGLFATLEDIWFNQSQLRQMGMEAARASQNWTWKESARKLSQAMLFGMVHVGQAYRPSYAKSKIMRRR